MFGAWVSLLIYALSHIVDMPAPVLAVTQVIVIASTTAGLYAAAQYSRGRD